MVTAQRVLIVDDDEFERMALMRALSTSSGHYEITETDGASFALQKLENERFDVILLDYRLPGTNGIEFLLKVKSTPQIHNTAIIMVSNYSDDELIIEAINAGAHDFLLKEDVTPSQLKRSILQSRKRYELENELYQSYQKVKRMAERDALTGLYNRYHFDEAFLQILKAAKRNNGELIAIMMMDLDKFKIINDSHGHNVGDLLIIEVSKRLRHVLRSNELLARFGGDEFALVCEHLKSLQEAKMVGNRIVKAMEKPFEVNGTVIHCSASIGMALCPANGDSAGDLMRCADIAMYRAKQNMEERLCVYKDNMQEEVLFRYKVESELRKAKFDEDFALNFQPIVKEGVVEGAETLLRWPAGVTTKRPDQFIPVAEDCGVISRLGEWVLERALTEMREYLTDDTSSFYLSVNVSPHQLHTDKFADSVISRLNKHGIAPDRIVIEITETVLLSHDEVSMCTLSALSEAGIKLALDDFGTGYSSLSHLLTCPIDIVKVDKSLISEVTPVESKKMRVLIGLSMMLQQLEIKTVAEGVEDEEQAAFCSHLGLTSQQGYLYAKPVPAEAFSLSLMNSAAASA